MKIPIYRPVSWPAIVFQLAVVGVFAFGIALVFGVHEYSLAFLLGALAHAIIYRIARAVFTADHRRGIRLFRAKRFREAAPHFEASYAMLSRRPWLDRFRWLLLGSASSMSYREMALCNAAFCYGQFGDGSRAMALYEQVQQEFPDSGVAAASLNMLRSVQSPSVSTSG